MRIIERHIIGSIARIFLSCIFVFCFLYVLIEITGTLDEIIDRKIPFVVLFQYYSAFFPIIFVQTSPFACLIAVLLTFSNLNNSNEIIVMRSSGMNFWQITRPALVFALVVSSVIFVANEKFVPDATSQSKKIRDENIILLADRKMKKKEKINNLTFYVLKNRLYFMDTFDPLTSQLQEITIIEYDNDINVIQKIVAFRGVWTGIAWKFYQLQITTYDNTQGFNSPAKVKVVNEKLMDIKELPDDFMRQRLNVDAMNIKELNEYIERDR